DGAEHGDREGVRRRLDLLHQQLRSRPSDRRARRLVRPRVPGQLFTPANPIRILDTRDGVGTAPTPIVAGAPVNVKVTGRNGVPAGATAVALNVTASGPTGDSHLTLWPTNLGMP